MLLQNIIYIPLWSYSNYGENAFIFSIIDLHSTMVLFKLYKIFRKEVDIMYLHSTMVLFK